MLIACAQQTKASPFDGIDLFPPREAAFIRNAVRIFGIDVAAARQAMEGDLLYKLRDDGNPLPAGAAPL